MRDSICIFAFGENYSVAAVETGGKQMSPGHLHLDRFESLTATNKNSRYPVGYLLFLAEDEGFELGFLNFLCVKICAFSPLS